MLIRAATQGAGVGTTLIAADRMMRKSIQHEAVGPKLKQGCFAARGPGLIYFYVLLNRGHACFTQKRGTNGFVLLYKINAKWLPANLSDPLTTRHSFARAAEPAGRSCCQTYHKQPQPAIALLRSAEFPPFSQADYIHVVFSLAEAPRGPVLWKWFVEPR